MAGADGIKLELRIDEIVAQAREAMGLSLDAIALQIESQVKVEITTNDQVDTGFLRESVYALLSTGSHYSQAVSAAKGKNPDGQIESEAGLGDAQAAVAVGAEYASEQEQKKSFLFRGAEKVAKQAGATIEQVGGGALND